MFEVIDESGFCAGYLLRVRIILRNSSKRTIVRYKNKSKYYTIPIKSWNRDELTVYIFEHFLLYSYLFLF